MLGAFHLMEFLKSALYFLVVLSVLVLVHEWGHFIVAKLCKMRVDDFSLFFGKRLIRVGVRNGTEYNIRSIPMGGFVKIAGMEPDDISNGAPIFKRGPTDKTVVVGLSKQEADKTLRGLRDDALADIDFGVISERVRRAVASAIGDDATLTDGGREELEALLTSTAINSDEHRYIEAMLGADREKPDPNGYNQKPLWQRAAVIFAGPFMSLFFGYVLFCIMGSTTGLPEDSIAQNTIEQVIAGKPAERAGLKAGDTIVAINGKPITDGKSMVEIIHASPGRPLQFVALRGKERLPFTVTPDRDTGPVEENGKIVTKPIGLIGIQPRQLRIWARYPVLVSLQHGTRLIANIVTGTLSGLFSRHVRDNVGGPIAIARQIDTDSKEGPRQVLLTGAFLSVSLGIVNLFPIPILDGGHLVLLAIEGLRRRKLSSREVYLAQMVGLSIIGAMFVFVMFNDILRLIGKH